MRPRSMVLDTDIGTDVDDALALAYAIRHPGIDLRAVTTVSADTDARARIAARLLGIAGHPEVVVAAGVGGFEDRAWFGHEGERLAAGPDAPIDPRDAATVLLDCSHESPQPVVATIGMQSNIDAALRRDPSYPRRVPLLAVMGGVFGPAPGSPTTGPSRDHNLVTDPQAAVRSLDAGFPIRYVPLDVTVRVQLRTKHVERLRSGDELGRALAELVDVWHLRLHERSRGRVPDDVVAFMHDPLTVACAISTELVTIERLPVTVAIHRGVPRTFVDPIEGVDAEVVTDVQAETFVDHWLDVVTGAGSG